MNADEMAEYLLELLAEVFGVEFNREAGRVAKARLIERLRDGLQPELLREGRSLDLRHRAGGR